MFVCQSCDSQKAALEKRKSKVTGTDILVCTSCTEKNFEPRHLLIIAYHSDGKLREKAIKFIRDGLYAGKVITLKEVL